MCSGPTWATGRSDLKDLRAEMGVAKGNGNQKGYEKGNQKGHEQTSANLN